MESGIKSMTLDTRENPVAAQRFHFIKFNTVVKFYNVPALSFISKPPVPVPATSLKSQPPLPDPSSKSQPQFTIPAPDTSPLPKSQFPIPAIIPNLAPNINHPVPIPQ